MNSFLQRIAQTFYHQYPLDISNFTFVFPNKRAGLFFQNYIIKLIDKPIFSPEICTVNELFYSASELKAIDRTELLFRLYAVFKQISKRDETFDIFAGWGEMLISDFDEVDKYLVKVEQIFTNVSDLKEIDYLFNPFSEKQVKALQQFWEHFVPITEGKTQEDFIAIWRILLPIYQQLRTELLNENRATEAMIMRDVVEKLEKYEEPNCFKNKQFVFVGFNALNPSEIKLFEFLQKHDQADFYWDYESEELRDEENPASAYFKNNVKKFPSKLKIDIVDSSLKNKEFELISIPSAVGQAKEVYHLLNKIYLPEDNATDWIKTAVVLPDENLLIPLLHSLPLHIQKVNVTMGFPLKSTPVAGLIEHLFDLQKRVRKTGETTSFYYQTVQNILQHPYIQLLCHNDVHRISEKIINENKIFVESEVFAFNPLLKTIFTICSNANEFLDYLTETVKKIYYEVQKFSEEKKEYSLEYNFLYQYFTALNRLKDVIKEVPSATEISLQTMIRIIKQLTAGLTIPFKGEPLDGLQVMGTLETRGLDFENLIICSFNDGVFPKRSISASFIPYNLRKAFELPTSDNQDAISAYNFYRLIQRAKKVYFLYDPRTEGIQSGEVSRFAHQLRYHYGIDLKQTKLVYDIRFTENRPIIVTKTPDIQEKLRKFVAGNEETKAFSASSLNNYVACPLKFYFSHIEKIDEPDEVEENIEANMFGTLLHSVMQEIYKPYEEKLITADMLEEIVKNPVYIDKLVRSAFADKYFKKKGSEIPLEGNYLLIGKIIEKYARRILTYDKTQTPFTYIKSEELVTAELPVFDGKFSINLKGFIDRTEQKEGKIRLIDYKSGAGDLSFKNLDEVFQHDNEKPPKYVLQTFLYSALYRKKNENKTIVPLIYYVKNIFDPNFKTDIIQKPERGSSIQVEDFATYEEEFNKKLTTLIEEIYDVDVPFVQCKGTEPCKFCNFNVICRKV